jgi:hypothetical protein
LRGWKLSAPRWRAEPKRLDKEKMRKVVFAILFTMLSGASAFAQGLTADDVAIAYVEAVTLCAKAKLAGAGIAELGEIDRARVAESDAQMRAFVRAPEGRPVWDVLSGRGIVAISEPSDSECHVSAYGPRVRPVFQSVADVLTDPVLGFTETETQPDPTAIVRTFERIEGDRRVTVRLDGGEPGMPSRTFRFPLLLAYVRVG